MAIARDLGADACSNYRTQSVAEYVAQHTDGKGFDVVFDTVGGAHLEESFAAAALNGTVVSTSARTSVDLSPMHAKGLSLHVVFMLIPLLHKLDRARHGNILTQLAQLVDAGQIRPLLDERHFSFADVAAAHRHLESGQAIGKVVLRQDCW
jgi:NADPH2:quinone reductase